MSFEQMKVATLRDPMVVPVFSDCQAKSDSRRRTMAQSVSLYGASSPSSRLRVDDLPVDDVDLRGSSGEMVEAHRRAGVRNGGGEVGHVLQRVVERELDPHGDTEPVGLGRAAEGDPPSLGIGHQIAHRDVEDRTRSAQRDVAEELLPDHERHVGEGSDVEAGVVPDPLQFAGRGRSGHRASRRSGSDASPRGGRGPARGSTTRIPRRSRS